jgi:hypothetical protein
MKQQYEVEFVDTIPENINPDVLYVCRKYMITEHICPRGCGSRVPLPIIDGQPSGDPLDKTWGYVNEGGLITLSPSILFTGGCRSHYHIQKNRVV